MNLGSQIKKYRAELGVSQEELAERIFVSRQSVSNWETGKTYPDIKSLLLLSEEFSVSLDTLIKGDIKIMKKEIDGQSLATFQKDTIIFTVLFLAMIFLAAPMVWLGRWWSYALYMVLAAIGMFYALRVERHKKKHDVHTYKEIMAFAEGKSLDSIEKAREEGKRSYQKLLLAVGSGCLVLVIATLMSALFY